MNTDDLPGATPHAQPPPALAAELAAASDDLRRGDVAASSRRLSALLSRHAGSAAAHVAVASWLVAAGRPADALPVQQRAVALAPEQAVPQLDLGRLLAHAGRPAEAIAAFAAAAARAPANAEAWRLHGLALHRAGRTLDALPSLRRALALAGDERSLVALADAEFTAGFPADALPLWQRLHASHPGDATVVLRLAETHSRLGDGAAALALLDAAAARSPDSPGLALALAQAREAVGDREGAAAAYDRALALRPGWPFALGSMLGMLRGGAPDARLAEADALLAGPLDDDDEALLAYETGKVLDARGDAAGAFDRWTRANAARRRRHGEFDPAALRARTDRTIALWPAGSVAPADAAAAAESRPVFVVGMPRSGTTLTERILGAHPSVWGAGELMELQLLARRLATRDGSERPWPVPPGELTDAGLASARGRWLQAATRRAPPDALRLVDKEPLNFQLLGLAARMFPGCRVVWCRRDPRDIAVSIYGENFAFDQRFATSLPGIATMIREQERLMRHWQATLPTPMLELQYEAMVADPESQSRRLLDFVGLPWDPACLAFHRDERTVLTPSRWQVREPVHARSVGRWRRYEDRLAPFIAALETKA